MGQKINLLRIAAKYRNISKRKHTREIEKHGKIIKKSRDKTILIKNLQNKNEEYRSEILINNRFFLYSLTFSTTSGATYEKKVQKL